MDHEAWVKFRDIIDSDYGAEDMDLINITTALNVYDGFKYLSKRFLKVSLKWNERRQYEVHAWVPENDALKEGIFTYDDDMARAMIKAVVICRIMEEGGPTCASC